MSRPRLMRSEFARNVAVLLTGTTIAQGISVAFAPVMTRLFSPKEYGLLALFISITGILGVAATGQYSLAIIQAESEEDASNVLFLCFSIAVALSLLVLLLVGIFGGLFALWLRSPPLSIWLYWLPMAVLLSGYSSSVTCWLNRHKSFKGIAIVQIIVSAATIGVQLFFGARHSFQGGLIASYLIASAINSGVLAWRFRREPNAPIVPTSLDGMKTQARKHFKFPRYSLPTEFLNVTTNQVPVMVLNALVGTAALGHYNLTQRILGLPSGLIAGAITNVFRQRASADYVKYGNCRDIYIKTFKSLLFVSLPIFVLMFFFAPPLFVVVFGEKWREAGDYTRALSVVYFLGFISSPLSYVYYIAGMQKEDLALHFYMILSTVLSIYLGFRGFGTTLGVIWCFSLNYAAIYAFYLVRSFQLSKGVGLK